MLISIIVPVYNGEKKIIKCLESLHRLKESDIEFIVVNDGSTDKTSSICDEYMKMDSRFRLINKENGGVSSARNVGITKSIGKYIGFIDADDELTAEYDEILEIIKRIDSDFFAFEHCVQTSGRMEKRVRSLFEVGKNEPESLYRNFLSGIMNCVWNNIYSAAVIKDNQICFPQNMNMGEDSEFNAQYIQNCTSVYFINIVGYIYYVDDMESASNSNRLCYLNDFMRIYEKYDEIKKVYGHKEYSFYCPYYIDKIFEILKKYRKQLSKIEKKEFKDSSFYREIMQYKYKKREHNIKKQIIRLYLLG